MVDWAAIYRPMLGKRLKALVWMPITGDTPQLIADFRSESFSYSGSASLAFEGCDPLVLTWDLNALTLVQEPPGTWASDALDRVHADRNEHWEVVDGAVLQSTELYAAFGADEHGVVGVRHEVIRAGRTSYFWLGTGGPFGIGEGDDLWVGVNIDPPNHAALRLIGSVA